MPRLHLSLLLTDESGHRRIEKVGVPPASGEYTQIEITTRETQKVTRKYEVEYPSLSYLYLCDPAGEVRSWVLNRRNKIKEQRNENEKTGSDSSNILSPNFLIKMGTNFMEMLRTSSSVSYTLDMHALDPSSASGTDTTTIHGHHSSEYRHTIWLSLLASFGYLSLLALLGTKILAYRRQNESLDYPLLILWVSSLDMLISCLCRYVYMDKFANTGLELHWIEGMNNGKRLSQMLDGWVGPVERMLIAAGEASGTMEASLQAATRVMVARKDINGAVIKGLAYPLILVMVAFAVLYMFGFKVVPEFTKIVPADRFHGLAAVLIGLSDFARSWILVTGAAVIALVVAFFVSLSRWDGRYRVVLDRYPPYSIYRIVQGSTWLIGLSSMLEAGVRLETALQQLSEMADKWLANRINSAVRGMRAGLQLGDALNRSGYEFPDREIIDDLGVYSSLSGFDEALSILGREWLSESVEQIKARMNVVFGVALLSVAVLVGTMVGGMMTMQLQMSQIIQQRSR